MLSQPQLGGRGLRHGHGSALSQGGAAGLRKDAGGTRSLRLLSAVAVASFLLGGISMSSLCATFRAGAVQRQQQQEDELKLRSLALSLPLPAQQEGGGAARDSSSPPKADVWALAAGGPTPAAVAALTTVAAAAAAAAAADDDPMVRRKMVSVEELKAVLARMEGGRPVMGTIANLAVLPMLLNWLELVRRARLPNVLVACCDAHIFKACEERNVSAVLLSMPLPSRDFRWDPRVFLEMGTRKTAFVLSVLELGWDVVMSDTDVAWLRDPAPFLRSGDGVLADTDIVMTSDSTSHASDTLSQEKDPTVVVQGDRQGWFHYATPKGRHPFGNIYEEAFNTGVMFIRSNAATLRLMEAWHHGMRTKGKAYGWAKVWGDQYALNQLMRQGMFPIRVVEPPEGKARQNRVIWTFNASVRLGILPLAAFCNGHIYFVQRIPQRLQPEEPPYVVHSTFQFQLTPGKISRFRDAGLWTQDPPEYYTQGNYLSTDVSAPEWITSMPPSVEKHVAAMQFYYEAIRNAYAVARITARRLILPKLTCYCDKWWNKLGPPCYAHGGDVDPPFECPIDHFLNILAWGWDAARMSYRTPNFLDNPLTSDAIRKSRMDVHLGEPNGRLLLVAQGALMMLQPNATNKEVWSALGRLKSTRLLHLHDPHAAFSRFETVQENEQFDLVTRNFFSLQWCCTTEAARKNITIPPLTTRTMAGCGRPNFVSS